MFVNFGYNSWLQYSTVYIFIYSNVMWPLVGTVLTLLNTLLTTLQTDGDTFGNDL